jgi:hypothetical protein
MEICRKKLTAKVGDLNRPLDFDSEEFAVAFCYTYEHIGPLNSCYGNVIEF